MPDTERASYRRPATALLAGLAIGLTVAAAHGGALRFGFVAFDDDLYVTDNPQVKAGLTADGAAWALRVEPRKTYYHPLTWLSLMLDAEVFGVQHPWGFHLTNLLLHAATAILLYLLLARATGRTGPPLAAALLFAAHPLTVEAVAWVTERKSVLSAALGLAAILAYLRHAERPSRSRLAPAVALQALSLLAKPTFVVLPALLLLLDVWPLRRLRLPTALAPPSSSASAPSERPLAALLLEKLPFALLSVLSAVVTTFSTSGIDSAPNVSIPSLSLRLANAVASFASYLSAAFWPASLSVFHPFPREVPIAAVAAGFALVVLLSAGALLLWRRTPAAALGWGWFLVALTPALGLHQTGLWPAWADRFAYVPLMGLATAVAFAAADLATALRLSPRVGQAAAVAVTLALSLATRAQILVWSDSYALYRHAIAVEPRAAEMHWNLATLLLNERKTAEAAPVLERLVEISPGWSQAHAQLGSLRRIEGRIPEAERHLREALRLDPDLPEPLFNLAEILRLTGRAGEARPLYLRFARVAPEAYAAQRQQALRHAGN
jgi:tetratricopeptide (TPR) repeat protein